MNKLNLLVLFISASVLFSQQPDTPTHHLELLTPDATEPVTTSMSIYTDQHKRYICIEFPDGFITTEYILVNDSTMKFQLADIRNNGLVTIQFIGTGKLDNRIEGKFTAMVDGVRREDMSGQFKITKYQ